jgi:dihydrofolate synthase/folylpolyglutamate synthase
MSRDALEQWLQRLESIHPREVELGLDRVAAVARMLELLPVQQRVVTVAGTNGKGSTVAVLEALMRAQGLRTGAYTSPHFLRFNERIRVDGVEAGDAEIVEAFAAIDAARGDVSLTYFEFATLAALWVFQRAELDVLLLEVGLGGRLDAVNVVDPSVAVITGIDLDHQGWLGESREEIAREKAGILRRDSPAVIAERDPPDSLRERAAGSGADPVLFLGEDFALEQAGSRWKGWLSHRGGDSMELSLEPCGGLLPENVGAALQAALVLGVEFDPASTGPVLQGLDPVGRRQRRKIGGRHYLLDVAHNPAAVNKMLEDRCINNCNKRKIAIFSAMADKDIDGMLVPAAGCFDAWFLADQPDNPRAAAAADIAAVLRQAGQGMISISRNLRQALRRAQQVAGEGDLLVVFGSFHTVAAVLPQLERDAGREVTNA